MELRARRLIGLSLGLLSVVALAYYHQETASPTDTFWTLMGACGSIYGAQVTLRRWQMDRWRRRLNLNGLFAITVRGHTVLRICGLIGELLILISGTSSMLTPKPVRDQLILNDWITGVCVIGLGAVSTFAVWYAERIVEQTTAYLKMHPEE